MTLDQSSDLLRQMLLMALTIAAPILIVGLAVGLLISLFQALTQIQEQTLTFVPKIAAMVAASIALMPWISTRLVAYAQAMFSFQMMP